MIKTGIIGYPTLNLTINNDTQSDVNKLLDIFHAKYSKDIQQFTNVSDQAMEVFGLGSLWCYELPFTLGLKFIENVVILTIEDMRSDSPHK